MSISSINPSFATQPNSRPFNPFHTNNQTKQKFIPPEENKAKTKNIPEKTDSFYRQTINWFGKYHDLILKYLVPPLAFAPALTGMKSKSFLKNIVDISTGALVSFACWCLSMHIEKLQKITNSKSESTKKEVIKINYPFDPKHKDKFTAISDPRSHHGMYEHAMDFLMPIGTDVLAVKDGTVIAVVDSYPDHKANEAHIQFETNGSIKRNDKVNEIMILGEDGLIQHYAHPKYNSSQVKVGDIVKANTKICESGHNGNSSEPHLHFTLFKKGQEEKELISVPIQFID